MFGPGTISEGGPQNSWFSSFQDILGNINNIVENVAPIFTNGTPPQTNQPTYQGNNPATSGNPTTGSPSTTIVTQDSGSKYMPYILIGGVALVAILLLKK